MRGLATGLGGKVNQLFSRAMTSTFATSSIAGRKVLSANSAADFESARAEAGAAKANAVARAKSRQNRSDHCPSRSASFTACYAPIFRDADLQPFRNQAQDALVRDTVLEETDNP